MGAVLALVTLSSLAPAEDEARWPGFRGVDADGIGRGPAAPASWSLETGENVLWKTPIPGLGLSSPVVWDGRIYLTTAVGGERRPELKTGLYGEVEPVADEGAQVWQVIALDTNSGEIAWAKDVVRAVPRTKRHPKSSHASSTAATNGERIVTFLGSEGLFCLDAAGEVLWKRDLGKLDAGFYRWAEAQWGFGASPVLHGDRVIIQCDVQGGGFVASLDLATGEDVWRTPRDDVPTWSTPAIHVGEKRAQVIVNGYRHIGGYELATGKELWRLTGGGDIPVPTPILGDGLVYITNAHGRLRPIYAVRLDAEGDISLEEGATSNEHVAWAQLRRGNYMQTPLLLDGLLYGCFDNGVLGCYDAKTGDEMYLERLGTGRRGFTASPVASGEHLYFTSEDGDVHVIRAGRKLETRGVHSLGEPTLASPAIADGRIYFRGREHLIAIGTKAREPEPEDAK